MSYRLNFPRGYSDEEKQLKKKYAQLEKLKSYVKDKEESKMLKSEWERGSSKPTLPPPRSSGVSAREVAMKLIRTGKIKIPAKPQNMYEREKLKPIRRSSSQISVKKSDPGAATGISTTPAGSSFGHSGSHSAMSQERRSESEWRHYSHDNRDFPHLQSRRDEGSNYSRADRIPPPTDRFHRGSPEKLSRDHRYSPPSTDDEDKHQLKRFKHGTMTYAAAVSTATEGRRAHSSHSDKRGEGDNRRRYSNKFDRFADL